MNPKNIDYKLFEKDDFSYDSYILAEKKFFEKEGILKPREKHKEFFRKCTNVYKFKKLAEKELENIAYEKAMIYGKIDELKNQLKNKCAIEIMQNKIKELEPSEISYVKFAVIHDFTPFEDYIKQVKEKNLKPVIDEKFIIGYLLSNTKLLDKINLLNKIKEK